MMNVSASRRTTTPLIFIFCPLATVRELLELVVGLCDNAIEAEISSTLTASAVEATVRNLVVTIKCLLLKLIRFDGALLMRAANRLTSDDPSSCCVVLPCSMWGHF